MTAAKLWQTRTADGRDLSREEWRVIPGFTRYEITKDGDIRNRTTRRLLTEHENPKTGAWYYSLIKDAGGNTCRNYQTLLTAAWEDQ